MKLLPGVESVRLWGWCLTARRFWNLRLAISGFLRRRRATGAALEVLIGHMTFAGLGCRWTLAVFHLVYKFCRAHYYEAAPLWDGVRSELYAFCGLMIFLDPSGIFQRIQSSMPRTAPKPAGPLPSRGGMKQVLPRPAGPRRDLASQRFLVGRRAPLRPHDGLV